MLVGVVGARATGFAFGCSSCPRLERAGENELSPARRVAGWRQSGRDRARVLRGSERALPQKISDCAAMNDTRGQLVRECLSYSTQHMWLNVARSLLSTARHCGQLMQALPECGLNSRLTNSAAEKIALADVHAVVPQQCVHHRHVEIEIRQHASRADTARPFISSVRSAHGILMSRSSEPSNAFAGTDLT